nr:vegetative cell wall protein gp1 [Aegilops tauschii subsp. strangulata]
MQPRTAIKLTPTRCSRTPRTDRKKKKKKPHLRALPNLPILTRRRPPPPSLPPTARGAPTLLPIAAAVPNHRRRPGCAATTRRPAPRQTAPRALRPNHLCRLHTPATLFPSTAPCRQAPAPERHRPPTGHYSGASPRARAPIPYSHQPPELCRPGNNAAPERCPGPRTADSRRPWISSATTRQYTPRLLSQPSPGPLPLPIAAVVPVYLNLSFSSGSRASIPTPKGFTSDQCSMLPTGAPRRRPSSHLATTCRRRSPRPAARGGLDLHLQMDGSGRLLLQAVFDRGRQ